MRFRGWWWATVVVATVMLALGLEAGQWDEVRRWAQTLCTGCIGLY